MTEPTLLRAVDLCKSYEGVQALRHASFELRAGEVHALVGENGAGKSTLVKILTGAVRADGGDLFVQGRHIVQHSTGASKKLGIAAIYQQPALFPELSVAENVALGLEEGSLLSRIDWKARRQHANALLRRVGADIDPDTEAGALSMPQQQLVEIARALGAKARVLIMDEPTASLSERETGNLYQVIRELRADGVGIIYISHRLEELAVVADRVTVLRDGAVVATKPMAEMERQELIRLMVGRELSAVFPKGTVAPGETVMELKNVGAPLAGIHGVNLQVRAGEILGVAGLVGSGRSEMARAVFGLIPVEEGEVRMRGRRIQVHSPAQAMEHGIAYVPEDRRRHGVVADMPISANITLAILNRLTRFGAIDLLRERELAEGYVRRLAIKTPSIHSPVSSLSGGNQQKVALSRWLAAEPAVLILDEPTQGVDVGAKAEIHGLMSELAARGVAILMISSDLPEVVGMSDRVAVMCRGSIVAVVERNAVTPEKILALALGHPPERPNADSSVCTQG